MEERRERVIRLSSDSTSLLEISVLLCALMCLSSVNIYIYIYIYAYFFICFCIECFYFFICMYIMFYQINSSNQSTQPTLEESQ